MSLKKMEFSVCVSVHENGNRFYEWEFKSFPKSEVIPFLEAMLVDLKAGRGMTIDLPGETREKL